MNTAVITGGAGGMGLAAAKVLGRDHRIVIADLGQDRIDDAVKELSSLGITASGVVCDVTDEQSVHDLLLAAASEGNRVRAVIHTAGVNELVEHPRIEKERVQAEDDHSAYQGSFRMNLPDGHALGGSSVYQACSKPIMRPARIQRIISPIG